MSIFNLLNSSIFANNKNSSLSGMMKTQRQFSFLNAIKNSGIISVMETEAYKTAAKYEKMLLGMEFDDSFLPSSPLIRRYLEPNFTSTHYTFFEDFDEEQKEEVAPFVKDESKRIRSLIFDIYENNSLLTRMLPREFEEVIGELLRNEGFQVELTKQTRDNGFDILALKYIDKHFPFKFLVECKRYSTKPVGVEIIRSFKEVLDTEKANRGLIVTTSYFSSEAKKKQKEIPYLLDFRDRASVIDWVNEYTKPTISNSQTG